MSELIETNKVNANGVSSKNHSSCTDQFLSPEKLFQKTVTGCLVLTPEGLRN